MKILLDECLPRKLKYELPDHDVLTVSEMVWAGAKNGELLRLAETAFDVFITADQNMTYQQNLRSTTLGIIVIVAANNRFETLRLLMPNVVQALSAIQPGDLLRIPV